MGRTVREARLQERSARARLAPRHHPYWRTICEGRHLGYYKGRKCSSWVARCFVRSKQQYFAKSLGAADDDFAADGVTILSWKEALEKALAWFDTLASNQFKRSDTYTVGNALDDYLEAFPGKSLAKTRHSIERHIRPVLGDRLVTELT